MSQEQVRIHAETSNQPTPNHQHRSRRHSMFGVGCWAFDVPMFGFWGAFRCSVLDVLCSGSESLSGSVPSAPTGRNNLARGKPRLGEGRRPGNADAQRVVRPVGAEPWVPVAGRTVATLVGPPPPALAVSAASDPWAFRLYRPYRAGVFYGVWDPGRRSVLADLHLPWAKMSCPFGAPWPWAKMSCPFGAPWPWAKMSWPWAKRSWPWLRGRAPLGPCPNAPSGRPVRRGEAR